MLQDIIAYITTLDPALIFLVLFFFSYIENFVPMLPSDLVVVVGATMIVNSPSGFIPILAITTIGCTGGFISMFYVGKFLGENLLRKGKLKFIKQELLDKADKWFHKYGYKIILINRFMPGTRAVVSFFAGVHRLKQIETFTLAGLSSLFWNAILICLGIFLGNNIEMIDKYLKTYSNTILAIVGIIVIVIIIRFWLKKKRKTNESV